MKRLLFLYTLLSFVVGYSQSFLKIDYMVTINTGQKMESTLFSNNKESVFKIYDNRQRGMIDLPNGEVSFVDNDELSKFFYANDTISYARFTNYEEELVYSDSYVSKIKWNINSSNKRKIGKYECVEAKLRLNQRSYTVWFTFDVPQRFGPYKLHGLPGMIVEASEDTGYFKLVLAGVSKINDLKEFNSYKKYFYSKKKIMNYKDYEKRIIDDEVAAQMRVYAYNKEINLKRGNNITITSNFNMAKDNYLEYPPNLISMLEKVPK